MIPFKTHTGIIAPLDLSNVDTDQIIAKQFLKSIKRTGFGEFLFYDWRFDSKGIKNPDFSLNQSAYQNASILLTRSNFGCGSSREHAVWAIQQYGFRAVIAPSRESDGTKLPAFADIFRSNSFKNALLTIELPEKSVDQIFEKVHAKPGIEMTVDLEHQKVTVHSSPELSFSFEINPSIKKRLLEGLDEIGISLQYESAITDFEKKHNSQRCS